MRILTILFIASSCASLARADTKGVIGGRVTNPQNAAVAQATVVLKNMIDGRTLEATTGDDGTFEFRFVSAGEYTITVTGTGFSVVTVRAVVTSGQRVEINITLKEIRVAGEEIDVNSVKPEKDVQYDIGVKFAVHRFRVRVNHWFKRQNRFLDHLQLASLSGTGELINPNIFLPVNLDRARTHGIESFIEAPVYRGLRVYANYSLNYAQAVGGVIGGFNDAGPPERTYFFLDHDQRHQLHAWADYRFEKLQSFANATYGFGSGFPDASDSLFGECVTSHCRLPAHSVLNIAFGKVFGRHVETKFEIENITNRVYAINLGSEFNGSHISAPRLMTVRLGYRF